MYLRKKKVAEKDSLTKYFYYSIYFGIFQKMTYVFLHTLFVYSTPIRQLAHTINIYLKMISIFIPKYIND